MVAFFLISSIVTPPFVWMLVLFNLDYEANGCKTYDENVDKFLHKLFRSGQFWVWIVWCFILFMIFSGMATALMQTR